MHIKIHKSYKPVVAICDSSLLGKKFEEGIKQLDVRENFYNGQDISEEEIMKIMINEDREDATFNIVGEKATQLALKANIITKDCIGKIAGIPYALKLL
jgi:hypothetical protein